MLQRLLAVIITLLLITPAAANEYWLGQKPSNKRCKVLDVKPDGKTWVMLGTSSYPTLKEATAAKRAAADCKKKGEKNKPAENSAPSTDEGSKP
jgi:hypothetical protein